MTEPDITFHCSTCGYNLTGLPENRCPECGTVFVPEALQATRLVGCQPISRKEWLLRLLGVPAGCWVLCWSLGPEAAAASKNDWLLSLLATVASGFLILVALSNALTFAIRLLERDGFLRGRPRPYWQFILLHFSLTVAILLWTAMIGLCPGMLLPLLLPAR